MNYTASTTPLPPPLSSVGTTLSLKRVSPLLNPTAPIQHPYSTKPWATPDVLLDLPDGPLGSGSSRAPVRSARPSLVLPSRRTKTPSNSPLECSVTYPFVVTITFLLFFPGTIDIVYFGTVPQSPSPTAEWLPFPRSNQNPTPFFIYFFRVQ